MEILVIVLVSAAALAVVLAPIVRERRAGAGAEDDSLEPEIARYRAALRAGTVCGRCYNPNPEGSRFCAECGREL